MGAFIEGLKNCWNGNKDDENEKGNDNIKIVVHGGTSDMISHETQEDKKTNNSEQFKNIIYYKNKSSLIDNEQNKHEMDYLNQDGNAILKNENNYDEKLLLEENLKRLQTNKNQLIIDIQSLEEQKNALKVEIVKLEKDKKTFEEEIDQLEKDKIALQSEKKKLDEKEKELNKREEKLNNKETNLKEEKEKYNKELNYEREKLKEEAKNLNQKEIALNKISIDCDLRENNLKINIENNNKKEKDLEILKTNLDKREQDINNKEEIYKKKDEEFKINCKKQEESINEKNKELLEKNKLLINTENSLKQKESELVKKDEELKIKQSELEEKQSILEKQKSELEEKKSILEKQKTELKEKQSILEKQKTELEEKQSIFEEKQIEFDKQKSEFEESLSQFEVRQSQLIENENKFAQEKLLQEKILKQKEENLNKLKFILDQEKKDFEKQKKEEELSKLPNFVGLQNIGATCYMNATLQALSNTNSLTEYFLNNSKFNPNNSNKKMANEYYKVLTNLWSKTKKDGDYAPYDFKQALSEENPLFAGIQANDSKDLINFLLERFHQELNNPKPNNNDNNIINVNQMDEMQTLNAFLSDYFNSNQSIITDCFYGILETRSKCAGCQYTKFNFQIYSFLEFPLEQVNIYMFQLGRRFNMMNQGQKNPDVDLLECFEYYQKIDVMNGQNQMYCNICNGNRDNYYGTTIYSLPNYLIINLNRGKGAVYECKVNFPEDLNLLNFVAFKNGKTFFRLYAVICHLGESSMSGHFVAYCRHRQNNKWYKYNDSFVTECTEPLEYTKGMPYILFYKAL